MKKTFRVTLTTEETCIVKNSMVNTTFIEGAFGHTHPACTPVPVLILIRSRRNYRERNSCWKHISAKG